MIDSRQVMIVLQNALGHATELLKHNKKDDKIEVEELLTLAKVIAREVIAVGSAVDTASKGSV